MAEVRVGFVFDDKSGTTKVRVLGDELEKTDKKADKLAKTVKGELNKGLEQTASRLGPVGGLLKGLGPAGLAAGAGLAAATAAVGFFAVKVSEGIREAVELGSKLTDLRDATGLSVESLQRLGFAAEQGGATMEVVAKAVTTLERMLVTGSAEMTRALEDLGLSQQALLAQDPEDAFLAIATALRGLESDTKRAAYAQQLFGEQGVQLLPAIKTGMADAAAEAERLGLVMDNETAEAMDRLSDAVGALSGTWDGFWRNVGIAIAKSPEIVEAIESITWALGELSAWVREHGPRVLDQMKDMATIALALWTRNPSMLMGGLRELGTVPPPGGREPGLGRPADIEPPIVEYTFRYPDPAKVKKAAEVFAELEKLQLKLTGETEAGLAKMWLERDREAMDLWLDGASAIRAELESMDARGNLMDPDEMGGPPSDLIVGAAEAAEESMVRLNGAFQGMALLAGAIVGRFEAMVNVIGNVAMAFKNAKSGAEQFYAIAAGVGQIGGLIGGKAGSAIQGAAGGAMTGFAIGSMFGPAGAVPGAIIGGAAGFIGGLFGGGKAEKEERRRQEEEERRRREQFSQDATRQLEDLAAKFEDARRRMVESGGLGLAPLFEDAAASADLTQERLDRLSRMGAASLANLRAEGLTLLEAMDALAPTIAAALKAAEASGLELSGPLAALADFQQKLGTEAGQAFAKGAEGLAAYIAGLQATGSLSQDMLPDILAELGVLRERAAEAGISGGQELAVLAPILYQLQQAAEAGRIALDDETTALITAAEAGGHFEGLKDPMQELLDIQKVMLAIWVAMAETLGVDIPEGARKAMEAIGGIPGPPTGPGGPGTGQPDDRERGRGRDHRNAAAGFGPRRLDRDTVFLAHEGEHVLIVPKGIGFRSARRGFFDPRDRPHPGQDDIVDRTVLPIGGGGEGSAPQSAFVGQVLEQQRQSTAAIEALAAQLSQTVAAVAADTRALRDRPAAAVTVAPQVQVNENGLNTTRDREQFLRDQELAIARGIRAGTSDVAQALKDAGFQTR